MPLDLLAIAATHCGENLWMPWQKNSCNTEKFQKSLRLPLSGFRMGYGCLWRVSFVECILFCFYVFYISMYVLIFPFVCLYVWNRFKYAQVFSCIFDYHQLSSNISWCFDAPGLSLISIDFIWFLIFSYVVGNYVCPRLSHIDYMFLDILNCDEGSRLFVPACTGPNWGWRWHGRSSYALIGLGPSQAYSSTKWFMYGGLLMEVYKMDQGCSWTFMTILYCFMILGRWCSSPVFVWCICNAFVCMRIVPVKQNHFVQSCSQVFFRKHFADMVTVDSLALQPLNSLQGCTSCPFSWCISDGAWDLFERVHVCCVGVKKRS